MLSTEALTRLSFSPAGYGCIGNSCQAICFPVSMLCCCRCNPSRVDAAAIAAKGHKMVEVGGGASPTRKLEYAVGGDLTSDEVVYYQHGYANSCSGMRSFSKVAEKLGMKLIMASMPGFGLSDSYPVSLVSVGTPRPLADWPADVKVVLEKEGVTSCHLMGTSGGCPHTSALALGLPPSMVRNILLNTPTAPASEPGVQEAMDPLTAFMGTIIGRPFVGDALSKIMQNVSAKNRLALAPDCKLAVERAEKESPGESRATEACVDFIESSDHSMAFTHRGMTDNVWPIAIEGLPWLPSLSSLVADGRVFAVTTASDDTTNPPEMQRWVHEKVQGSTMMHFQPGWGHLHGVIDMENFERMLLFLKTGADPTPWTPPSD